MAINSSTVHTMQQIIIKNKWIDQSSKIKPMYYYSYTNKQEYTSTMTNSTSMDVISEGTCNRMTVKQ